MDGDLKLLLEQILQAQRDQNSKLEILSQNFASLSERITQNEGNMELKLNNIKTEIMTASDCKFVQKSEFASMWDTHHEALEKKAWEKVDRATKLGNMLKTWGGWLIGIVGLIAAYAPKLSQIFNK